MAFDPIQGLSNPMLRYKLDLGEPGLAAPSPATQSVLRVTGHELQNIHRFKAEAAREGGVVVYHGIKLDLRHRGSYLAAVAGHAEARIIFPDGREGVSGEKQGNSEESHPVSEKARSFDEALENPERLTNDLLSTLTAQSTITQLQVEKAHLQRELREPEAQTDLPQQPPQEPLLNAAGQPLSGPEGNYPAPQTSPKEAVQEYQIQQKIQKINQEIFRLTLEPRSSNHEASPVPSSRTTSADPLVESFLLDLLV